MTGSARAETIRAVVSGRDLQAKAGGEGQPRGRGSQVQSNHDQ